MTDEQNARIYEHYTAALAKFQQLPGAQKNSTPVPTWEDSAAILYPEPLAPSPKKKKADDDLAKAQAEEAAANPKS